MPFGYESRRGVILMRLEDDLHAHGDTKYARFIDEIARRFARNKSVGYLRSDQYPTLRLRYLKDRKRGAWDVLHWDGWHRVGNYPELDCATMLKCLPGVVDQLRRGFAPGVFVAAAGTAIGGRGAGGRPLATKKECLR
jgi:hypothetical protein